MYVFLKRIRFSVQVGPLLPSAVFLMLAKTVLGKGKGERTSAPAVWSSAGNTSAARKIFEARRRER